MGRIWSRIRRIWITLGTLALVVFVSWSVIAFRASAAARAALAGDAVVQVAPATDHWTFTPVRSVAPAGLVFFPGGLVDPTAYAPILRDVAREGFVAVLVTMPRRGAFGGADGPEVLARARRAMRSIPAVTRWVVAGHSLGGAVAARMAHEDAAGLSGLVLIGTSHPREFSLANTPLAVTRVSGTHDTVAGVEATERTRPNLPAAARIVTIEGGNHSQFGYYGFQPGDWPAAISREDQQRITVQAILDALRAASAR